MRNLHIFRILTKSLRFFVGSGRIALSLSRRGGEREKPHCKGPYFPVKITLELLSPLLLMCVRSNFGRNQGTAAIPYSELSLLKNLHIIYRIVGTHFLDFWFTCMSTMWKKRIGSNECFNGLAIIFTTLNMQCQENFLQLRLLRIDIFKIMLLLSGLSR